MFLLAEWVGVGESRWLRTERRAAQSTRLQVWAPPMVLSLFLVVGVLMLTILCVSELRQGPETAQKLLMEQAECGVQLLAWHRR